MRRRRQTPRRHPLLTATNISNIPRAPLSIHSTDEAVAYGFPYSSESSTLDWHRFPGDVTPLPHQPDLELAMNALQLNESEPRWYDDSNNDDHIFQYQPPKYPMQDAFGSLACLPDCEKGVSDIYLQQLFKSHRVLRAIVPTAEPIDVTPPLFISSERRETHNKKVAKREVCLEARIRELESLMATVQHLKQHCQAERAHLHNSLQPVSALPAELVGEILTLAVESIPGMRKTDRIYELAHVCRAWRTTAMAFARLWTTIDLRRFLGNDELVLDYLSHTANAPLNVLLAVALDKVDKFGRRTSDSDLVHYEQFRQDFYQPFLAAVFARTRRLSVVDAYLPINPVLPMLTTLRIAGPILRVTKSPSTENYILIDTFSRWVMPNLERLEICEIDCVPELFGSFHAPHLRVLSLLVCRIDSTRELLALLASLSALEELTITARLTPSPPFSEDSTLQNDQVPITISSLKSLWMSDCEHELVSQVFRMGSFPNVRTFHAGLSPLVDSLAYDDPPESVPDFPIVLATKAMPNVRRLILGGFIRAVVPVLDHLNKLYLKSPDSDSDFNLNSHPDLLHPADNGVLSPSPISTPQLPPPGGGGGVEPFPLIRQLEFDELITMGIPPFEMEMMREMIRRFVENRVRVRSGASSSECALEDGGIKEGEAGGEGVKGVVGLEKLRVSKYVFDVQMDGEEEEEIQEGGKEDGKEDGKEKGKEEEEKQEGKEEAKEEESTAFRAWLEERVGELDAYDPPIRSGYVFSYERCTYPNRVRWDLSGYQ